MVSRCRFGFGGAVDYICTGMAGAVNNKIVRALLMACVAMQVAALMPHHHHAGSDAPCIGYHCVTGTAEETHGENRCCGHGHHDGGSHRLHGDSGCHDGDSPVSACTSPEMVVMQPERVRIDTSAAEFDLPDGLCAHCNFMGFVRAGDFFADSVFREYSPGPDIPPFTWRYIAETIPPRAPDSAA